MLESHGFEALYDHAKDTFAQIREREKTRDRLFYLLLTSLALLAVAVFYFSTVTAFLSSVAIAGVKGSLSSLPIPVVTLALWVTCFALSLRYNQASITIDRQYRYLARVEAALAKEIASDDLFKRESSAYKNKMPLFSTWARLSYTLLFPAFFVVAALVIVIVEWIGFPGNIYFRLAETGLCLGLITNFVLYRLAPFRGSVAS